MKVNRIERASFYCLEYGDTFFIGDEVFLKISHRNCKPIECEECGSSVNIHEDGGYYAVNLTNGEVVDIEAFEKFETCECKVDVLKAGV
jgi:hypothetical protein